MGSSAGSQNSSNESFLPRRLSLKISATLRKLLWQDYQQIENNHSVLQLPRVPNVATIIADYLAALQLSLSKDMTANSIMSAGGSTVNVVPAGRSEVLDQAVEVLLGLRAIFDKVISASLLHRSERSQFNALIKGTHYEDNPSLSYGLEHLLRLFVKLPPLLFVENMTSAELATIEHHLNDFLGWLSVNVKNYQAIKIPQHQLANTSSQRTSGIADPADL